MTTKTMEKIMNFFGSNIRYLRKQRNMTQDELADILGYKSFTTIQKWESGLSEPNLKILKQIADIFKVDIDKLAKVDLSLNTNLSKPSQSIAPTQNQETIIKTFNQLNYEGQEKAIAYTQDLVDSGKYAKKSLPTVEEMIDYLKEIPMAAFDGKLDIYKMPEDELYTLYKLIKDNE